MDVSEGATELHGWLVTKDLSVSCLSIHWSHSAVTA